MRRFPLLMLPLRLAPVLVVAACAASGPAPSPAPAPGATPGPAAGAPAAPQNSPECQAARLRPVDPMPVGLIPADVLRKAQNGWVAVRYDVVAGKARNATVVSSSPPGLYDAYVLRHVGAYAEPTGASVGGCVTTTNIRF